MKELKCPNCGGPLVRSYSGYNCEYCGSKFEKTEYGELCLIQVGQPQCKVIEACASIPNYIYYEANKYNDLETVKKSITKELTERLAEELIEHIVIHETYDIKNDERVFRGQLRVIDPEHKY